MAIFSLWEILGIIFSYLHSSDELAWILLIERAKYATGLKHCFDNVCFSDLSDTL